MSLAIEKNIASSTLKSKVYININTYTDAEYQSIFNILRDKGYIGQNCDYRSIEWVLFTKMRLRRTIVFDLVNFNEELKKFILVILESNTKKLESLYPRFTKLRKFIINTNLLNFESVEELIFNNVFSRTNTPREVADFIEFVEIEELYPFIDRIRNIRELKAIRNLPPYNDLLLYDELLDNFVYERNLYQDLYIKFFPVIFWWKFTSITPVRPTEFALIDKNALKKIKNKYYIYLPRIKKSNNEVSTELEINEASIEYFEKLNIQKIRITENLYSMVEEYKSLTINMDRKTIGKWTGLFAIFSKLRSDYVYNSMADLLNSYHSEVIKDIYGYKILKTRVDKEIIDEGSYVNAIVVPTLGDTRHLAFTNMMLQEFNSYTMMVLGGHSSIDSQLSYTSHAHEFVESSINTISNSLSENINVNKDIISNLEYSALNRKLEILHNGNFMGYPKVDDGRCSHSKPGECCPVNTPCQLCEYHIFDMSIINHKVLDDTINNERRKLTNLINYLGKMYKILAKKTLYKLDEDIINKTNRTVKRIHLKSRTLISLETEKKYRKEILYAKKQIDQRT